MKDSFDWLQTDLNEEQRKAVMHTEGPVLVLAGAGSGKTRVLTYRIAYILASGLAEPREILAMTFTNKAAGEMRERVTKLVPDLVAGMWIGTFHSLFARLLRREGDRIGYKSNFSIYDEADQKSLLKSVYEELKIDGGQFPVKSVLSKISNAKNRMISPKDMEQAAKDDRDLLVSRIYRRYQSRLRELNAMDFDDLLIKPIELFNSYPLVMQFYQDRFRYILVDEYQDTNHAQYLVLRMLAQKHKNICVVGDDDQSIYRWRGADLRNILDFESDYPRCAKYRLEQNYRSTKNILAAAHSVVKNNQFRHEKELWTARQEGEPVIVIKVDDEREEAQRIVGKINEEFRSADRNFCDFAILYRTNAQSRVLEEALRREGIPYVIVGGLRFYDRKEVKDVLAYLKVIVNPADSVSLRRIINYPLRGIGSGTVAKLEEFARENRLTLYEALFEAGRIPGLSKAGAERVLAFAQLLKKYRGIEKDISPAELATALVEELGILALFKEENTVEALSRAENVRELLFAIAEFVGQSGRTATLADYLQHVTLVTDVDTWDDRSNAVTLMTLHSAKGLEFSVVFITGLEEGLFPLSRNIEDPHALEEERRLFYVGATRAREKLYLSWARNRRKFGALKPSNAQSRFLKELDSRFIRFETSAKLVPTSSRKESLWDDDTMPDYENESQEVVQFRVGMRVLHPVFGKGTIIKINRQTGKVKLNVLFDVEGERRLVLPYAKLEIL